MSDEDDTPLTPIEESRASTGKRFFKAPEAVYSAMTAQIDEARGYPHAVTQRALPTVEDAIRATDNDCLVGVDISRMSELETQFVDDAIEAGNVDEITGEEYFNLQPDPVEP